MKVRISKSLAKDTAKITDKKVKEKLFKKIEQLQSAENLSQQPIKKLKGFKDFYRIRIGDYRLGVKKLTEQEILLVRFLQRKEIYRYFPKRD
mgnify:CR=1 FL=1